MIVESPEQGFPVWDTRRIAWDVSVKVLQVGR